MVKFPRVICADQAYQAVVEWALLRCFWLLRIVTLPRARFEVQPKRWIVERTFGWLNRSRRMVKSFERTTESEAAFIHLAMIHLMVKRLNCSAPRG